MARLKIKDAPLLTSVVGDEKIPTGGKGDFTLTPDMLLSFVETRLPFTTTSQLESVRQALDAKINTTKTELEASIDLLDSRVTNNETSVLGVAQDLTLHKADKNNPHGVTKSQVGLGNVDNTSDINKPVSTATQNALNLKFDKQEAQDKIYKNGAALPYDSDITYNDGAIVVKDGELQQYTQGSFVTIKDNVFSVLKVKTNFNDDLNALITELSAAGGGSIRIPDGEYFIKPEVGITLKSNINIEMGNGVFIKIPPSNWQSPDVFKAENVKNVTIKGGNIVGNRYDHLTPSGETYTQLEANKAYTVGQYIWIGRWGCVVTTAGTTASTLPHLAIVPTVGESFTSGTATFKCIEDVGEWGMAFSFKASENIKVSDINISDVWGDGFYLGRNNAKAYCENVTLENVTMTDCRRQGISVISLKKALFRNVIINNVFGAEPQAGVDFEPNYADEYLQDIVIDKLVTNGCLGGGVNVIHLRLTSPEDRISITIRNHTDTNSVRSFRTQGVESGTTANGYVIVENSDYHTDGNQVVYLQNNNADAVTYTFKDCHFRNNVTAENPLPHIRLSNGGGSDYSLGGLILVRPSFYSYGVSTTCVYVVSNSPPNKNNKNILIDTPLVIPKDSLVFRSNARAYENFKINDALNVNKRLSSTSPTINNDNIMSTYEMVGTNGTFNIASFNQGQEFSIRNNSTVAGVVNLAATLSVQNLTNTTYPSFGLAIGGYIKLRAKDSKTLVVIESFGVTNSAKSRVGTVTLAAVTLQPNIPALVAIISGMLVNRNSSNLVVTSSYNFTGRVMLQAQVEVNGDVSVYATNLTDAAISVGTGTFINVTEV